MTLLPSIFVDLHSLHSEYGRIILKPDVSLNRTNSHKYSTTIEMKGKKEYVCVLKEIINNYSINND